MRKNSRLIKEMAGIAILGALVAVTQLFIYIPVGEFTITFALVPIVVAAIIYGPKGGAFCGFVMGLIVLLTNATLFLSINPTATVFACLLKSGCAGLLVGYFYKWIKNKTLGCYIGSIAAPLINTGIFTLFCFAFFAKGVEQELGISIWYFMGVSVIPNFLIELGVSIILAPVVVKIINMLKIRLNKNKNIEN